MRFNFFNSNMINPNYTVKADPIKIFYSYAMLSAIQIPCYLYITDTDDISFTFIFVVLFWLFIVLFKLISLSLLIKHGRPQICFHSEFCQIQMYAIKITINYAQISAFSMRKIQQEHRGFSFGMCYELDLMFIDHIMQQHFLWKKAYRVKNIVISSNLLFKNIQILEIAIIFSALVRMKTSQRIQTLLQLQQNLITYDHLISNKELENFKNNQYIYKLFKFGQ